MPDAEDFFVASGPLRLKNSGRIEKKKKKGKKKTAEDGVSTAGKQEGVESGAAAVSSDNDQTAADHEAHDPVVFKTGTERRFEAAQREKLKRLIDKPGSRPGLLKTHKERVEELNTYLSKLSEHHDMPKIGPG